MAGVCGTGGTLSSRNCCFYNSHNISNGHLALLLHHRIPSKKHSVLPLLSPLSPLDVSSGPEMQTEQPMMSSSQVGSSSMLPWQQRISLYMPHYQVGTESGCYIQLASCDEGKRCYCALNDTAYSLHCLLAVGFKKVIKPPSKPAYSQTGLLSHSVTCQTGK